MEEPMVKAEIMVTTEFIGAIMELCQEKTGSYTAWNIWKKPVHSLKYRLPLNEIIYDFFDALKSRSRGYASFDYELDGYESVELVKLDILVNKEEVDALSFIVHAGYCLRARKKDVREAERGDSETALSRSQSRQLSEARLLPERR